MRTLILLGFSVLFSVGCASEHTPEPALTLDLIHINDTHSHFDASPAKVTQDGQQVYTFVGGFPRLFTQAEQLKQQAERDNVPSLFLHGGDAFKGTAYFELFEQRINIDLLNRMHIDAMALGNHEFDIGLTKLADFIDNINFPMLVANLDTSAEPALAASKNIKPFTLFAVENTKLIPIADVKDAKGRTLVGVFGLALEDIRTIAPDTGELVFHSEVQSAQNTVNELTAMGVQHIVALTHIGHQRDLTVAAAVNGIDAIVGGHSHTLLGDFRQWGLGQQRPYAELITNPDGHGQTCVLQAGRHSQAIGQARLAFNPSGELISCNGHNTILASGDYFASSHRTEDTRLNGAQQQSASAFVAALPLTAVVKEDPTIREVLDTKYKPALKQAYGELLAVAEQRVNHYRLPGADGSDVHGSELAGLITDGMVYWLNREDVRAKIGKPVDFTLIGAGNIRTSIEAGEVFEGNIRFEVLPFNTPLSVMSISGKQLKQLLTSTISASIQPEAHTGKYPYGGGLRYVAKETAEGTADLTQLQVLRDGKWQDVQSDSIYTMATTQYLADGNDGWQLLPQTQQQNTDRLDVILQHGKPTAFTVNKITPMTKSGGELVFKVEYDKVEKLPCEDKGTDCKAAAQAFIDYLKLTPTLLEQARQPTVTLLR